MTVTVCQIGARRHYAVPRGLQAAGALERLVTDVYAAAFPWRIAGWLPRGIRNSRTERLLGRRAEDLDTRRVTTLPDFALRQMLGGFAARPDVPRAAIWAGQNQAFATAASRCIPSDTRAVYAFNGAALEIFRHAKPRGVLCVLDQTSAPWRYNTDLLTAEAQRWPDWEAAPINIDPTGRMIAREEAEWQLADRIVCGSQWVVEAIGAVGGAVDRCRVVGYPTPAMPAAMPADAHGRQSGPVRVLYVGRLELGKGIQYLWQAARSLDPDRFQFRAVGGSGLTPAAREKAAARIECIGPVPRAAIWEHYAWADVVVLPTLSEGSANVCHEALACGRPVITTPAAGLPADEPGATIVSARDVEALAAAIAAVAERPGTDTVPVPCNSIARYGQELMDVIDAIATKEVKIPKNHGE